MKVGDYVRTKNGIIGKIEIKNYMGYADWLIDTLYYNDDEIIDDWTCGIKEYDIKKSSPNIIDLIEEDDFINGCRITELMSNKNGVIKCMVDSDYEFITTITNKEIKRVVTKEQFEEMEYKIND